jgi:hypothetical protein
MNESQLKYLAECSDKFPCSMLPWSPSSEVFIKDTQGLGVAKFLGTLDARYAIAAANHVPLLASVLRTMLEASRIQGRTIGFNSEVFDTATEVLKQWDKAIGGTK